MSDSKSLESSQGYDIGIDFGTSKCAMYWASLGEDLQFWPVILEGNSEILRSAVYVQPSSLSESLRLRARFVVNWVPTEMVSN
jgi:hypothetical protein